MSAAKELFKETFKETISFKEALIAYKTLELGKIAIKNGRNSSNKFESSFKSASSILMTHDFLLNEEPLNASPVSLSTILVHTVFLSCNMGY